MLPTDAKARKGIPIYSGFICYFPDAMAEVALLSKAGNDQHNPGKPLHWDRSKSGDEKDALARHLVDGSQTHGVEAKILEARAVAWRAMADLQKLCELREQSSNLQKLAEKEDVHEVMRRLRRQSDGDTGQMVDLDNRHPQGRTFSPLTTAEEDAYNRFKTRVNRFKTRVSK